MKFSPANAPRRHSSSHFVIVAFAVVFATLILASCSNDGASRKPASETPRGTNAPQTSLPMPPVNSARTTTRRGGAQAGANSGGWTLLDGRRASLSDLRGQVVVLDFYATYCPPCRDEIPHLNALYRRYESEGVRIVGLNVGGEEDYPKVPQFVEELKIAYPLGNPDDATVDTFLSDNTAIPQTYVFDRQGRLVKRFVGFDPSMPAELEAAINAALQKG